MKRLSYFIDTLTKYTAYIAALLSFLLALLIVFDAVNRYLFHSGSIALQELEWHFFDLVVLLGLAYALKHDKHVRVDIFYEKFSKKTKLYINIVGALFFIIRFCIFIIYYSFDFVMMSYMQQESSSDPGGLCCRYLIKSAIPLGFALLALQALSEVIKNILYLREAQ